MTDLIIGCFTGYDWNKLKYWANSIVQSGFTGDKAVIVFNADFGTVQQFLDKQFDIFAFGRDDDAGKLFYPYPITITAQRFYHLWEYLSQVPKKYKNVIATDVTDVVFQSDPSIWLSKNLGLKKIIVGSEGLRYIHDYQHDKHLEDCFPMMYEWTMDKTIWNCGVLAGEFEIIRDLFLNIYLVSLNNTIYNSTKPALNILLNLDIYKKITKFASSDDGWVCHTGTVFNPDKMPKSRPYLVEPEPYWDGQVMYTSKRSPYVILHQWDKVLDLKIPIESKYC